ncbi:hypothetical protein B0H10DRAFT_1718056, partial [Mycena sp. CBHHK59/15]
IMQMMNSLTSKLQIGSPMASLYLLGNPDHYTNLTFKVFWWRSYLMEVKKSRPANGEKSDLDSDEIPMGEIHNSDKVVLMKTDVEYLGVTNVDDYMYRPHAFEDTCLYDYFQMISRK